MPAYGWLPPTPDARDRAFHAPRAYTGGFVDLSANFPEAPYDQQALGSCVSNGVAALLDFARLRQGLTPYDRPSRLFVYYQGRLRGGFPIDQDTGLQVRDGLTVVAKDGAPVEATWPYDIAKFTQKPSARAYTQAKDDVAVAYGQVDQDGVDDVISSGYPVVFGFTVYESFESDAVARTGVMPEPASGERQLGGHCVVAVSTPKDGVDIPGGVPGTTYRRCRNSWGTSWGDKGYFWMPVKFMDSSEASDFWTLTHVSDPNAPVPPTPPADPDAVFAQVLHPWVQTHHTSIAGNSRVAKAAKTWLLARSL